MQKSLLEFHLCIISSRKAHNNFIIHKAVEQPIQTVYKGPESIRCVHTHSQCVLDKRASAILSQRECSHKAVSGSCPCSMYETLGHYVRYCSLYLSIPPSLLPLSPSCTQYQTCPQQINTHSTMSHTNCFLSQ